MNVTCSLDERTHFVATRFPGNYISTGIEIEKVLIYVRLGWIAPVTRTRGAFPFTDVVIFSVGIPVP